MPLFTVMKTYDGSGFEVVVQGHQRISQRKYREPRRLCLCTHEDDAKCIAEAMELYEATDLGAKERPEYYSKEVPNGKA